MMEFHETGWLIIIQWISLKVEVSWEGKLWVMFNQLMADWGKVCWGKNWSSALESWNNFFFCITKLGGSWRKVIYALEFDLNEVKRIESRCERKMFFDTKWFLVTYLCWKTWYHVKCARCLIKCEWSAKRRSAFFIFQIFSAFPQSLPQLEIS